MRLTNQCLTEADPTGRLTQAVLTAAGPRPQVTFGYSFAASGGCCVDPNAGLNGSRTGSSIQIGTGTTATSSYCYDTASRLTAVTGASPVNATDIGYDSHGNATRVGDQTWTYDAADRVSGTKVLSSNETLAYSRAVTGRVVSRTASGPDAGTTPYGFTAVDDAPDFQLGANNSLAERYASLPGGILYIKPYAAGSNASYNIPNLRGDIAAQAVIDPTGALTVPAAGWLNDPYGRPLNTTTGVVDSNAVPGTRTGTGTTDSWLGPHQRGYEHTAGLNQVLMGARTYLPTYGIFTAADPVEGGNDSTYTYPNDPINRMDLDGNAWWDDLANGVKNVASKILDHPVVQLVSNACDYSWGHVAIACGAGFGTLNAAAQCWDKGPSTWLAAGVHFYGSRMKAV
jgi:RHS repeat-associated protein